MNPDGCDDENSLCLIASTFKINLPKTMFTHKPNGLYIVNRQTPPPIPPPPLNHFNHGNILIVPVIVHIYIILNTGY